MCLERVELMLMLRAREKEGRREGERGGEGGKKGEDGSRNASNENNTCSVASCSVAGVVFRKMREMLQCSSDCVSRIGDNFTVE